MNFSLRGIFAHMHSPAPKEAPADFDADAFNRAMTDRLDAGAVNYPEVFDALGDLGRNMPKVSIMVRARMMGILSDDLDALRDGRLHPEFGARKRHELEGQLIEAGQFMAVHSQVPDDIVEGFHDLAETIVLDIELHNDRQLARGVPLANGDTPFAGEEVCTTLDYFNACIADRFRVSKGFEAIIVDDASKGYGSAGFNNEKELHELEANIRYVKTLRDLPKIAATSMHEGMHMVIKDSEAKFYEDPEGWRHRDPSFYIMMRVCSRNFYTTKDPTYRRLPEEVLAERVGIRFAMRLNEALDCKIPRDEFMAIVASTIPHKSVFADVERTWEEAFGAPTPAPASETAPPEQAKNVIGRIRYVASVLKNNF